MSLAHLSLGVRIAAAAGLAALVWAMLLGVIG
jgi:hypothetical protein